MKYIPGFIKRLIKVLIAGAFTFTVAACYGIIMDYRFLIEIKALTSNNPIKGISLQLRQSGTTIDQAFTDETGFAMLANYSGNDEGPDFTVLIEDIDGPENGGPYQTEEMPVTGDLNGESEYTFILTE